MTDKIDTSDVRRFSPEQDVVCEFLGMWEKPDGDYVCWEEYEALAAERDRLAAQLAEARAEGWRKGIEAAAAVNNFQAQEILDNAAPASAVNALRWAEKCIRALPMPAFGEPPA